MSAETHSEFYERWSARARPYFAWQFSQFAPYIGKRAVDVGCGLGSFVEHFLAAGVEKYLGVEPDPELRRRFDSRHRDPRVGLTQTTDAVDPGLVSEMRVAGVDTAFSVNVLEHIERDDLALSHMIQGTTPGGHVCLLVPAHPFLYGTLDALDHHFRRYTKRTFLELIGRAGGHAVDVRELHYFNAIAAFGWFLKGRVIRETAHGNENFAAMNAVLPVVSRLENLIRPPFGLSLIAVLRRK
jgi:SAM-dependent methyltransferase